MRRCGERCDSADALTGTLTWRGQSIPSMEWIGRGWPDAEAIPKIGRGAWRRPRGLDSAIQWDPAVMFSCTRVSQRSADADTQPTGEGRKHVAEHLATDAAGVVYARGCVHAPLLPYQACA